jgi:hypothetical protein
MRPLFASCLSLVAIVAACELARPAQQYWEDGRPRRFGLARGDCLVPPALLATVVAAAVYLRLVRGQARNGVAQAAPP